MVERNGLGHGWQSDLAQDTKEHVEVVAHPACVVVDTLEGPQPSDQGRVGDRLRACLGGTLVRLGVSLARNLACDVTPARLRLFFVWHRFSNAQGWRQLLQQSNDCK